MCVPLPQEWGHSSLSMFFFGGRHPSFPTAQPPLSIFPCLWVPPTGPPLHVHPWCPAKGWLLPAPIYYSHLLLYTTAPSHPPSWIQGLPLLPLWGNCWVRMAPALMEPRGHSAMDRLWGQHWELFCTSQECQVLVTLCPVPHCQCSASGDTLGGKEHGLLPLGCMALPGVGDLWWLGGASDQPRT